MPDYTKPVTWTNADSSSIGPLITEFRGILIKMLKFSLKENTLEMLSVKC